MTQAMRTLGLAAVVGLWVVGSVTAANAQGGPGRGTTADTVTTRPGVAALATGESSRLYHMRDLSGPRVGFTFAVGHDATTGRSMFGSGVGPVISQFGWHLESQVVPLGNGPMLITEVIPLFGGFEYGKVIPSITLAVGLRSRSGWEIGAGPSLTPTNGRGRSGAGVVIAGGRTIDYGGVSLPFNLAVSMNPNGTRVSLLAGYAIQRAAL